MIDIKNVVEHSLNSFINHVGRLYPIPEHLLHAYKDEFDWRYIDQNNKIAWNRALIDQYKERFRWGVFTRQSGFHWEVEDLKRFKGYLKVDWLRMCKHFKVTEEFLKKPPKKDFALVTNNIYFTQEL